MSLRFAIFYCLIWCPLMLAIIVSAIDHFAGQLSIFVAMGGWYVWMLAVFAPLLWDAFFRKSK